MVRGLSVQIFLSFWTSSLYSTVLIFLPLISLPYPFLWSARERRPPLRGAQAAAAGRIGAAAPPAFPASPQPHSLQGRSNLAEQSAPCPWPSPARGPACSSPPAAPSAPASPPPPVRLPRLVGCCGQGAAPGAHGEDGVHRRRRRLPRAAVRGMSVSVVFLRRSWL